MSPLQQAVYALPVLRSAAAAAAGLGVGMGATLGAPIGEPLGAAPAIAGAGAADGAALGAAPGAAPTFGGAAPALGAEVDAPPAAGVAGPLFTRPSTLGAPMGRAPEPSAALIAATIGDGALSPGMGLSTGTCTDIDFVVLRAAAPDLTSSRMPSHLRAGRRHDRSWLIALVTISRKSGVGNTCAARSMVAATASQSSMVRLSGSSAPMWKPVTPSLTVSTRPPVDDTSGTVPYCIACSWIRPHGSKRDGTMKKSAPAVMMCASGAENLTTPLYCPANCLSSIATCFSIDALPVPSTTTCAFLFAAKNLGSAPSRMSTPFCSSRRPMKANSGAEGSTGRPHSACSCSFAAALPAITLVLSYFTVSSLSVAGSHSSTSMPLTMPVTPFCLRKVLSSTPLSGPDMISVA
eukprot:356123-Chlamydomonas_euryale.AAC.13